MNRRLLAVAIAVAVGLSVSGPAWAQAVAVLHNGSCGVALMQNGDVFLSVGPQQCNVPQGEWAASGNIFALAGRTPSGVAGMTTNTQILGANGDWFQLITGCPGTPMVTFQGNVFEITGVVP